jgi:CheY-like chemotaxis protein
MVGTDRKGSVTEDSMDGAGVLVVDDDVNYLMMLSNYFDTTEFRVFYASSGEEALSLLRTRGFFLMLTDYNMPEMDGLMLSREAKKIAPEMIIVMATGDYVEYLKPFALAAGVNLILPKPVNFAKLFSKTSIENMLVNRMGLPSGEKS